MAMRSVPAMAPVAGAYAREQMGGERAGAQGLRGVPPEISATAHSGFNLRVRWRKARVRAAIPTFSG